MLKKVASINGLGLLHDTGASKTFGSCTLLFADNGRGKSTFTALLESLRLGDMAGLRRMQTIDQTSPMTAKLVFDSGPSTSDLENSVWSSVRPDLRIFDASFVRANVYAGTAVEPEQRRSLLGFVLGDSALVESQRERDATEAGALLRSRIRDGEAALAPHLHGMLLDDFTRLVADPELSDKIAAADTALAAQRRSEALLQLRVPTTIPLIEPELSVLLSVLTLSLADIGDESERLVREHLQHNGHEGLEEWARRGVDFESGDDCPFCGQSLLGVELVTAYRRFFSAAYEKHLTSIRAAIDSATQAMGPVQVEALTRRVVQERDTLRSWAEFVATPDWPLSDESFQTLYSQLAELVLGALREKLAAPLSVMDGTATLEAATAIWGEIEAIFATVNAALESGSKLVAQFQETLRSGDIARLEAQRELLEAQRIRFTEPVSSIVDTLKQDRIDAAQADSDKEAAREAVRALMDTTLTTYRTKINALLSDFGAGFEIREMKTNFRGAAPQSEWVLGLRNHAVPLKTEGGPDFDSALSEGDKRTLAFAFFSACVLSDPRLAELMIVIDDPMSSMDAARRAATIAVLVDFHREARQLVLSSHDALFLRDFRSALQRADAAASISEISFTETRDKYSVWDEVDLDILCEALPLKLYRQVEEFVDNGLGNAQSVAVDIRPLLEGYLHLRFPTRLKEGLLLRECIAAIRSASGDDPLVCAQDVVDEIEAINTYAGQFHHNGNPGYVAPVANSSEVRTYARRALNVLYGRN